MLLACGGLGTTRVVINSLPRDVTSLSLKESVQFVLPFATMRGYQDPTSYSTFTLNQFNMLVEYGRNGIDLAQIHLYPYNPTFDDALPGPIGRRRPAAEAHPAAGAGGARLPPLVGFAACRTHRDEQATRPTPRRQLEWRDQRNHAPYLAPRHAAGTCCCSRDGPLAHTPVPAPVGTSQELSLRRQLSPRVRGAPSGPPGDR